MIEIRLLGAIDLRASPDREELQGSGGLLSKRKPVAFLAYLALEGRHGPLRRDSLLGVFWPDSPEDHARNALNQTVFVLRKALGGDALVTLGADVVGLDPALVRCDAAEFERAVDEGDLRRAVELYGGDLLPGLHVPGDVEFERWLAEERERLRKRAVEAAMSLAESELRSNPADAVYLLRRAAAWDPYDERVLRRLVRVLDALGDRSGAVREFEAFRERLEREMDLEPTPETRDLVEGIRAREASRGELPEPPLEVARPALRESADRRRRVGGIVLLVALGLIAAGLPWLGDLGRPSTAGAELDEGRILVAGFENRTGDPRLDALGAMASDGVIQGLARSGVKRVVPLSTVMRERPRPREDEPDDLRLARDVGAGLMITGSFYARGDSIVFQSRVVDVGSGEVVRAIDPVRGLSGDPNLVARLGSRVQGSLAGLTDERMTSWADPASQPPTLEAYRDMAEGFDLFQRAMRHPDWPDRVSLFREAGARFTRAGGDDASFVAPLLWAIYAYMNAGDRPEVERLMTTLEAREDLSTWDQTVLRLQRATLERDYDRAYEAARQLVDLSPDSEWLFKLGIAAYGSRRYRVAVDALSRLDPDRGWIAGWSVPWQVRIEALHALGDHRRELEEVERFRTRFPDDSNLLVLEVSALAGAGRFDEAVERVERDLATDVDATLPVLDRIAGEILAHGDSIAAEGLIDRGIAIVRDRPEGWSRDRRLATYLYWSGRLDEAKPMYARLARERPDDEGVRAALGSIAARTGDRAEAERMDRWLAARGADDPGIPRDAGERELRRARIAARLGDTERSLDLLDAALDQGLGGAYLWFHSLIDLRSLHGDPRFEALLRSRD